MTPTEFELLMQIVYSRWGAKAYPEPVKRRIWYFCHELPQKSFENIIYRLLDSSRAAPMPNEFKMLAYSEKDRIGIRTAKEPETKPSTEAKCWDCGDAGNLFAHRTDNESIHAVFRCGCPVGYSRPKGQGAQWNDFFARAWTKEPIYRKCQGDWRPKPDQSAMDMVRALSRAPIESKKTREGDLSNPFKGHAKKDGGEL